jgi:hypothetical protein
MVETADERRDDGDAEGQWNGGDECRSPRLAAAGGWSGVQGMTGTPFLMELRNNNARSSAATGFQEERSSLTSELVIPVKQNPKSCQLFFVALWKKHVDKL